MDEVVEKLQDILSIISLLENDMEVQKAEEVYIRAIKLIHKLIYEVYEKMKNTKCVE